MRFKLNLRVKKNVYGNILPISYQYELSSYIYGTIAKSDSLYADWLHNNGFANNNKRFKMFVFSNLFPQCKALGDRMCILNDTMFLYLSFLPDKSTEEFVKGIFLDNLLTIGDEKSKVQFQVENIEALATPSLINCEFQTLSPVTVSIKRENGSIEYVSPEREDYGRLLINNLKEKYLAFYGKEFSDDDSYDFELLSPAKSRLITIKANTPAMTKVKGYQYRFKLKADGKLMHIMYEAGLGEKNSTGFGMVDCKIEKP
jgi:CRISPR-associated endoribonuclease Cas6